MGVPGSAGSFPCPECPTKLARKSDLNQHMNSHTDKFKCHICGKRNSRSSTLLEHMTKKQHGLPNILLSEKCAGSPPLAPRLQSVATVTKQHPLRLFERLEKVIKGGA